MNAVKRTVIPMAKKNPEISKVPLKNRVGKVAIVDDGHVKIDTVKKAENQDGIILRLYETSGSDATITLTADQEWTNITETDLMETPVKKGGGRGSSIKLSFGPYEMKTLRLR